MGRYSRLEAFIDIAACPICNNLIASMTYQKYSRYGSTLTLKDYCEVDLFTHPFNAKGYRKFKDCIARKDVDLLFPYPTRNLCSPHCQALLDLLE